ncbi:cytochrome c oxidase assembly factor Coa1 family protein [Roseateles sp. DC23W]|uniref:Cytochrome c oxidase assembly factor Coa1 family protein n=1 Tax=Pelomonas dachongensis TaxID=3299029 RepID=A0ABW7EMB9_9BURK
MDTNDNTSGQGPASQVPPEVRRWSWGAFLLSWIWGIGNNTLAALAVFIPFFGFVWLFVLGARGSEWAWRNKRWDSLAQFQRTQRSWAKWGAIVWLGWLAVMAAFFFFIFGLLKDSDAYKLAQAQLAADDRIAEIVGRPLSSGFPMGQIQISGPRGSASLSFSVEGPKGEGTVFVEASKDMGAWRIDRLVFEEEGTGRRVDLSPPRASESVEGSV